MEEHITSIDLWPEHTHPRVTTLVVRYAEYPYDEFIVFILPDGSLQAYRSTSSCWKVADLPAGHRHVGASAVVILNAIFPQVDEACRERLTRVA